MNDIAIIGLGYVGLPLALAFSKMDTVIGFDIDESRIEELRHSIDRTHEVKEESLSSSNIKFTTDVQDIQEVKNYIVTVPTPVDKDNKPNLIALERASILIGSVLKPGDLVIYESTVYPGCTEEICIPLLENSSGLQRSQFYIGYSPERINPADKIHTLENTVKVVSGSCKTALEKTAKLYQRIIPAGVHQAESIKVGEAAKILENIQRDVNIALMNEFSTLCKVEGISTQHVINAATTKWNFLRFVPGFVGGHCIGVDPYYMIHRAKSKGSDTPLISAARLVNETFAPSIANDIAKSIMAGHETTVKNKNLLLLGVTFKENCPDYRNTKVVDLIYVLTNLGFDISIVDPLVDKISFKNDFNLEVLDAIPPHIYDGIICAVPHTIFRTFDEEKITKLVKSTTSLIADLKGAFDWLENSKTLKNIITL